MDFIAYATVLHLLVSGFLLQIEITDLVYLDHAGATLYSELQMESVFNDLTSNVYGNPRIPNTIYSELFYIKTFFFLGK